MPKIKTKQQQIDELKTTRYKVLGIFPQNEIMQHLISEREWEIGRIDDYIQDELNYIENETSSYAGAKIEARAQIKQYRKEKKEHQLLLKQLQQLNKAMNKLDAV